MTAGVLPLVVALQSPLRWEPIRTPMRFSVSSSKAARPSARTVLPMSSLSEARRTLKLGTSRLVGDWCVVSAHTNICMGTAMAAMENTLVDFATQRTKLQMVMKEMAILPLGTRGVSFQRRFSASWRTCKPIIMATSGMCRPFPARQRKCVTDSGAASSSPSGRQHWM